MLKTAIATIAASATLVFTPLAAQATELRAGHFIGSDRSLYRQIFAEWIEAMNQGGEAPVTIGQVVGPESIARDQWCNAVSSGLVDLVVIGQSYCNNLVPISEGLNAQTLPPSVLRENGAYDFLREIYAENANAYFLGQYGWGGAFQIFTDEPVATLEDLDGLRMRSTQTLRRFYDSLGVEGQMMGLGDTYTALERGVIDGFALPYNLISPMSLHELTTHAIETGVFNPALLVIVNLDTWNGMSDEEQAYLTEMAIRLEDEFDADFRERNAAMGDEMVEEFGIEMVTLSEEESARLQDLAIEGVWEGILEVAPEDGARLRELIN